MKSNFACILFCILLSFSLCSCVEKPYEIYGIPKDTVLLKHGVKVYTIGDKNTVIQIPNSECFLENSGNMNEESCNVILYHVMILASKYDNYKLYISSYTSAYDKKISGIVSQQMAKSIQSFFIINGMNRENVILAKQKCLIDSELGLDARYNNQTTTIIIKR